MGNCCAHCGRRGSRRLRETELEENAYRSMDDNGVEGLAGGRGKMGSEGDVLERFLEDGGGSGKLDNARVLEEMLRATDVPIVDSSDVKLGKKIGRGTTGDVFKADYAGARVAVKRVTISDAQAIAGQMRSFFTEVRSVARLAHRNVIALHAVGVHESELFIVMDYCSMGNLSALLLGSGTKKRRQLSRQLQRKIATDIVGGMASVHAKHVLHRDLKPDNILLDEGTPFVCRIADFGLARTCSADTFGTQARQKTGDIGTPVFMAPELLFAEESHYSGAVDVFAFGMILFMVMAQKRPYVEQTCNLYALLSKIKQGLRPKLDLGRGSPILRDMMQRCWAINPSERPSFAQLAHELGAEGFATSDDSSASDGSGGPNSGNRSLSRAKAKAAKDALRQKAAERNVEIEERVVACIQQLSDTVANAVKGISNTASIDDAHAALKEINCSLPGGCNLFVWHVQEQTPEPVMSVLFHPWFPQGMPAAALGQVSPALGKAVRRFHELTFIQHTDDAGRPDGLSHMLSYDWPVSSAPNVLEGADGARIDRKLARLQAVVASWGSCFVGSGLVLEDNCNGASSPQSSGSADGTDQFELSGGTEELQAWSGSLTEGLVVGLVDGTDDVSSAGAQLLARASSLQQAREELESLYKDSSPSGYNVFAWEVDMDHGHHIVLYHPWFSPGAPSVELGQHVSTFVDLAVDEAFKVATKNRGMGTFFGATTLVTYKWPVRRRSTKGEGRSDAYVRKLCHVCAVVRDGVSYVVGSGVQLDGKRAMKKENSTQHHDA